MTQQTFTPPDPALAPAFIELAASWPLADADFQILAHLVGLFPQVNDKSQIEIDAPALSKALGIAPLHLRHPQSLGHHRERAVRLEESRVPSVSAVRPHWSVRTIGSRGTPQGFGFCG